MHPVFSNSILLPFTFSKPTSSPVSPIKPPDHVSKPPASYSAPAISSLRWNLMQTPATPTVGISHCVLTLCPRAYCHTLASYTPASYTLESGQPILSNPERLYSRIRTAYSLESYTLYSAGRQYSRIRTAYTLASKQYSRILTYTPESYTPESSLDQIRAAYTLESGQPILWNPASLYS